MPVEGQPYFVTTFDDLCPAIVRVIYRQHLHRRNKMAIKLETCDSIDGSFTRPLGGTGPMVGRARTGRGARAGY